MKNRYTKDRPYQTKRQYQKLIRQISLATEGKHAAEFISLLSAMRGPDDSDEYIKFCTTIPIRNALGWRCGIINAEAVDLAEIRLVIDGPKKIAGSYHFANHIQDATRALEFFGFTKNRYAKKK